MDYPKISVIGLGALGTTLLNAFSKHGMSLQSVFNRTDIKAKALAGKAGIPLWGTFPQSADELGEFIFITVPDDAISSVVGRLLNLLPDGSGKTIVHCSGNESASLLSPLKEKGCAVASLHPLQTFTKYSTPADFKGIYFSLQGDAETFSMLKKMVHALGASTLEVNERQKSCLHAAAVIASNYLNALVEASVETVDGENISKDQIKQALMPLVKTTIKNIDATSPSEALSGPIKRGDFTTVEKHLELLEDRTNLKQLYCVMGLQTVKLAESSGDLDGTTAQKLRTILKTYEANL